MIGCVPNSTFSSITLAALHQCMCGAEGEGGIWITEMSKSGFVIFPGVSAVHLKMTLHWSYLLLLNVISKQERIT